MRTRNVRNRSTSAAVLNRAAEFLELDRRELTLSPSQEIEADALARAFLAERPWLGWSSSLREARRIVAKGAI